MDGHLRIVVLTYNFPAYINAPRNRALSRGRPCTLCVKGFDFWHFLRIGFRAQASEKRDGERHIQRLTFHKAPQTVSKEQFYAHSSRGQSTERKGIR